MHRFARVHPLLMVLAITCLAWLCSHVTVDAAAATDPDLLAAREAAREAARLADDAAGRHHEVRIIDGTPRPRPPATPTAAGERRLPAPAGETIIGRDGKPVTLPVFGEPGGKSMANIIGDAGMGVPLGGDDILVGLAGNPTSSAYLQITADGRYFAALMTDDLVDVYQSLDKGESWTLWSTFSDFVWQMPRFLVAEGLQNRAMFMYQRNIGGNLEIWLAHADINAATPTWTTVQALAIPGGGQQFSDGYHFATDAGYFPDYFVYVTAELAGPTGRSVWFARSTNMGDSFETPYQIAADDASTGPERRIPQVAYGPGNRVHVTMITRRTSGSDTVSDVQYRRAGSWANGGIGAWGAVQTVHTGTADADALPLAIGTLPGQSHVFIRLAPFGQGPLPRMIFSTDNGDTWPTANWVMTTNLPRSGRHTPLMRPNGELVVAGLIVVGWMIDVVESRSHISDPTVWSTPQSYSHHEWSGGGTYATIRGVQLDPDRDHRVAICWVQTATPWKIIRFDAEWRRDPGYPNTMPGWPVAISGGGFTPPAIAQLDDDPQLEIVFATRSGDIHVLNHDGTPVAGWPVNIGQVPFDAPVAVGDLQGLGQPAVVSGNSSGLIHALDRHGQPLPGWPVNTGTSSDVYVSIGALGPPHPRYVVATSGTQLRLLNPDGSLAAGWGGFPGTFTRPAAIGDVDGDGTANVVVLNGDRLFVYVLGETTARLVRQFPGESFNDAPTLADVNGDGRLEIAVPTMSGKIYLVRHDGSDFSPAWPITVPSGSPLTAVSFAQILGTSEPELVFAERDNGLVHVYFHHGGSHSAWPKSTGSFGFYQPPILSPVNISGSNVSIATYEGVGSGTAHSWRNLGWLPDGWPRNLPGPVEMSLAAGDVVGDGRNNLVVVGIDFVTLLDVGVAPMSDGHRHWPMYGYNAQRTGCLDCTETVTSVEDLPDRPLAAALSVYPNPFNPATTIRYTVGRPGPVTLAVHDASGRRLRTLLEREHREAGSYELGFAPDRTASGVYFLRLETAAGTVTEKLVLLK